MGESMDIPRIVMVIDDDPTFCELLIEILGRSGVEVQIAFSVGEALHQLSRCRPDLILTDLVLPDEDGISLLRRLQSEPSWSSIPAIVISARVMQADRLAAREAGAIDFLPKPFSVQHLREVIGTYLHLPAPVPNLAEGAA